MWNATHGATVTVFTRSMLEVEELVQPGSTNCVKLRKCSLIRASFVDQDTQELEMELLVEQFSGAGA